MNKKACQCYIGRKRYIRQNVYVSASTNNRWGYIGETDGADLPHRLAMENEQEWLQARLGCGAK